MALISAATLIASISVFHLTIAYFLHTSPDSIRRHNLVVILSVAMKLPLSSAFSAPSSALSLLAAVLSLFGISDLVAVGLREEVFGWFWGSQAPVRLAFFFALTAYSYAGGPKGLAALRSTVGAGAGAGDGEGPSHPKVIGGLSDGLVFSWAFVELVFWFWIYITLRDERREAMAKLMEKRKKEEQNLR